ncbi:hypothetical protein EVAR_38101_1 [Eumeta japonica]|uniref:Uncharacterized protein n=1 Tax=Eumeta variegata TaxID=151549 RepID=A0A4C1WB14_EUMVA|nr:hypothetical protein EVAR_38101_1 [Eumeta japonica]
MDSSGSEVFCSGSGHAAGGEDAINYKFKGRGGAAGAPRTSDTARNAGRRPGEALQDSGSERQAAARAGRCPGPKNAVPVIAFKHKKNNSPTSRT